MFDEIEKRRPLSDSLQELEKWHAVGDIRDAFGKKTGGGVKLDPPELEGSEKQIKWAKDIRQKIIDRVKQLKRNFIGMELDKKYFEIAKQRINEA